MTATELQTDLIDKLARTATEPEVDYIDRLMSEGLIVAQTASTYFAGFRGGKPCTPQTIYKWMRSGHKLRDGRRVRLEFVRVGGKMCTTRPAILRFIRAQQENFVSA
jgi:hypothetical protein